MQVRFFINSPDGLVSCSAEHAGVPLPWGLDSEGPSIKYGPYFNAIANFLAQGEYQPLRVALSRHFERAFSVQEFQSLDVISQKHGAFYHVAQVRVEVSGQYSSFAINCAVAPRKQAFLESEFALLRDLNKQFPLGFIPHAYMLGTSPYVAEDGAHLALKVFIAEWFEGFQEFHLSRPSAGDTPIVKVWDVRTDESFLDAQETLSLYHQAAAILTAYVDPESFSQIYPWHHAAGDFVLKRRQEGVELRLITVRGYMPLMSIESGFSDGWIPIVHFFLNLSLRMRLDRLDGTGDMVWAVPACLRGVVSGFLEMWEQKAKKDPGLPRAPQVLEVLRSFTPEEWSSLADLVLVDGLVEADEMQFIQLRLEEHAVSLCEVLRMVDVWSCLK
jgi:hypothetical protein